VPALERGPGEEHPVGGGHDPVGDDPSDAKDEALTFCPKLIAICNQRQSPPLLGKSETPISATYNVGVITAEGCEILG
jgi:hypothetical protein